MEQPVLGPWQMGHMMVVQYPDLAILGFYDWDMKAGEAVLCFHDCRRPIPNGIQILPCSSKFMHPELGKLEGRAWSNIQQAYRDLSQYLK